MKEIRETRVIEEVLDPKVSVPKETKLSVNSGKISVNTEEETKIQGGSNMKTILSNAGKLGLDVLVIGGATVLSGALALFVKNRSKDVFNEAMRQQKEIRRMSKEKVVEGLRSFQ